MTPTASPAEKGLVLVGDIGGTNSRFALCSEAGPEKVRAYANSDFSGLAEAVRRYLTDMDEVRPHAACFAVACPVLGDQVNLTNLHWQFSQAALQAELGLQRLDVINDFRAMALCLPHLKDQHLFRVGEPLTEDPQAAKLVLGPGTGLGVAGLAPTGAFRLPLPGEGGHVAFAPGHETEDKVLQWFRNELGPRVSVEDLLCGSGLERLYRALAAIGNFEAEPLSAPAITEAALAGPSPARNCLNLFCEILGSVAGDMALVLGARGGVYIGGGIVPRFPEFLAASPFRARFNDKGRMSHYVVNIPTYLITADIPALYGAAAQLNDFPAAAPAPEKEKS